MKIIKFPKLSKLLPNLSEHSSKQFPGATAFRENLDISYRVVITVAGQSSRAQLEEHFDQQQLNLTVLSPLRSQTVLVWQKLSRRAGHRRTNRRDTRGLRREISTYSETLRYTNELRLNRLTANSLANSCLVRPREFQRPEARILFLPPPPIPYISSHSTGQSPKLLIRYRNIRSTSDCPSIWPLHSLGKFHASWKPPVVHRWSIDTDREKSIIN